MRSRPGRGAAERPWGRPVRRRDPLAAALRRIGVGQRGRQVSSGPAAASTKAASTEAGNTETGADVPARLAALEREVQEVRTRVNALFFAVLAAALGQLVGRLVLA